MTRNTSICFYGALFAASALITPAVGQEVQGKEPRRIRVAAGAQVAPVFPGARTVSAQPFGNIWLARGGELFEFKAPDDSYGISIVQGGGLSIGPAFGYVGSRTAKDVGANLPKVGATIEVGGFAQYSVSGSLRVRGEVRKGLGGHSGVISNFGADFVSRDGDVWLLFVGPRLTIADRTYQNAYFGVAPTNSFATGLPAYSARGGIQAVGLTAGYLRELSPHWGLSTFAKYDRLVGSAADSPIVKRYGSRNQFFGGLAATFTFGAKR